MTALVVAGAVCAWWSGKSHGVTWGESQVWLGPSGMRASIGLGEVKPPWYLKDWKDTPRGIRDLMFRMELDGATRWGFACERARGRLLLAAPMWFIVGSVAAPTALAWWVARKRPGPGCCRACGYDLRGLGAGVQAGDVVCPECGATRRRW